MCHSSHTASSLHCCTKLCCQVWACAAAENVLLQSLLPYGFGELLPALISGKNSLQEACHVLTKALSSVQLANIETAKRQNKLFGALKEGNDAIKQLQKEVTVEQAEQLMADSKEAKDEQVSTTSSHCSPKLHLPAASQVMSMSRSSSN